MSARTLARLLAVYAALLITVCTFIYARVSLHPASDGQVVATLWRRGVLVDRMVLTAEEDAARLAQAAREGKGDLVLERVVARSAVWKRPEIAFSMSFVPARDGLEATLDGKTTYVTVDDMLSEGVYDHGIKVDSLQLALGADVAKLRGLLGRRLNTSADTVLERAQITRVRFERSGAAGTPQVDGPTLSREAVTEAVIAAARFLTRGVNKDGRFQYMIDARTGRTLPGYDWPRHAGSTFFLAQAAALTSDPEIKAACARAAGLLRGAALLRCGDLPCVGEGDRAELGSTALALLAFSEIVQSGLDPSYQTSVAELARFVRAQQRPDGEFMHFYDRTRKEPIDRQGLYYSSEATLALARAYAVTKDPADLDAAARGLRHLVGPAWRFFGDRYYFGEEHWTCQALAELWPHSPEPAALDFCLRWQEFGRALQQRAGDSYFDADGAIGVSPLVTPRLTPVASRCEAGVATLDVARRSGVPAGQIALLDAQVRRAMALLVRQQFRPGPRHLFRNPEAVYGAMPGSQVDWDLRIDYVQHAGSAMIRWLEITAPGDRR